MKKLFALPLIVLLGAIPLDAQRKSDAEIEKCIAGRFAGTKLNDDGISARVTGGTAILTGSTKVQGRRAVAARYARSCGARRVTNNILVTGRPDRYDRYNK